MNYKTRAIERSGKIHHVTVDHAEYATCKGAHHTMLEHKTLAVDGEFDIHIRMPLGFRVHFTYLIDFTKALQIRVYEDSIVTGATKNSRCRNLLVNKVDPVVITLDGIITEEGMLKADVIHGSIGVTPFGGQGGIEASDMFLFPEDFTLRFRCTSLEADNNVRVRMNFMMEKMLEGE